MKKLTVKELGKLNKKDLLAYVLSRAVLEEEEEKATESQMAPTSEQETLVGEVVNEEVIETTDEVDSEAILEDESENSDTDEETKDILVIKKDQVENSLMVMADSLKTELVNYAEKNPGKSALACTVAGGMITSAVTGGFVAQAAGAIMGLPVKAFSSLGVALPKNKLLPESKDNAIDIDSGTEFKMSSFQHTPGETIADSLSTSDLTSAQEQLFNISNKVKGRQGECWDITPFFERMPDTAAGYKRMRIFKSMRHKDGSESKLFMGWRMKKNGS